MGASGGASHLLRGDVVTVPYPFIDHTSEENVERLSRIAWNGAGLLPRCCKKAAKTLLYLPSL